MKFYFRSRPGGVGQDLKYMTQKRMKEYTKKNLAVNINKTKYICTGGLQ